MSHLGALPDTAYPVSTKLTSIPLAKAVGDRRYRFKLSDGTLDRDGDVIDVHGWDLSEYERNPIVLWSHDLKIPAIGRCPHIAVERDALVGDIEFPPEGVFPFADQVRGLIDAKILTTTSVGFRPIRGTPTSKGMHYHEAQLLEWSIVNVPSNPSASIQGLTPKAQYDHHIVKELPAPHGLRATRLQPHTQGLDAVRLKSFLTRSDMAPSQYCPKQLLCPAKASQLQPSLCPARDCPLRPTGKEALLDIDLDDDVMIDAHVVPAIKEAMLGEMRAQTQAMGRDVVRELMASTVRPWLREHSMRLTGRLD